MKLDSDTLQKLKNTFASLDAEIMLLVKGKADDVKYNDMVEFAEDFTSASDSMMLRTEDTPTEENAPKLEIWRNGQPVGVTFVGVPGDRELESLVCAIQNAVGQGYNLPDEAMQTRIEAITGPVKIFTFVTLSCAICPDVVQALNLISLLNPQISNTVVDAEAAPEFAKSFNVSGVPVVYADGELLNIGQASLAELVGKLEDQFGTTAKNGVEDNVPLGFDALIAGGGPAGVSAAIYLARKGMKVAVVAGRIGGQVKDTTEIANLISIDVTTGSALADDLRKDLDAYDIAVFDHRRIVKADLRSDRKRLTVDSGEIFEAPQVIIATGASWRKLNVPGEEDYLGKGVAFCTHCDGPFYRGKRVAVVGGGNSGVEAAIDLAALATHVDLFEFTDTLNADEVLQKKLATFANVDIHLSTALTQVKGDGKKLTAVVARTRSTGGTKEYAVDGIFVQIGLTPNTQEFEGQVALNERGEVITDALGRTSVNNVYAAGDVTDAPYKQIVIAIGAGATAALTASAARLHQ